MQREKPSLSAGLMSAYPGYFGTFRDLLHVLVSQGGVYVPEVVELGGADNYATVDFKLNQTDELVKQWESRPVDKPGWVLHRNNPVQVSMMVSKLQMDFNFVNVNIERNYIDSVGRIAEFVRLLKALYNVLHPAYGDIRIEEMIRLRDHPLGKMRPGTNLMRGLPDVYWANFLGPEYVEMLGHDRVLSAPGHVREALDDGGALLIVTPSPLDYLEDSEGFDRLRQEVKQHLGIEAFDTGDPATSGKIPKFRYVDERRKSVRQIPSEQWKGDWLSQVDRDEWRKWLQTNRTLALAFARESSGERMKPDFSPESLKSLDDYIQKLREDEVKPTVEFVKKVAAYVSQVLINETHANWSFGESEIIPSLRLGEIQFSPLARAQKAILEGERFDPWFRFLMDELTPKVNSKNPSRES